MMDTINISSKLKDVTYLINAFKGQEPFNPDTNISIGSGVAINNNGDLLTAAHVITGRTPIIREDSEDTSITYVAKTISGPLVRYIPIYCGFFLENEYLNAPLTIDLGILRPIEPQNDIPYLNISLEPVKVGKPILMSGYPDDMELPFSYDKLLILNQQEKQYVIPQLNMIRNLLMIKSGMIGHSNSITFWDKNTGIELKGEICYIDNQMHSGASGGPVVDENTEIIGIIIQRAITSVPYEDTPDLKVPSGSTVMISPRIIKPIIDSLRK